MIKLDDEKCIIGFDDGYQLGKTANFIFDNGVHRLGAVEPTLKENSLFYDGEFFKVGEGRSAITEDKISDDSARLRTMTGIAMELRTEGLYKAEVVLAVGLPFSRTALNPSQEVEAAIKRVDAGFSTAEEETAQLTGGDYNRNIRKRAIEAARKREVDKIANPPPSGAGQTPPDPGGKEQEGGTGNA